MTVGSGNSGAGGNVVLSAGMTSSPGGAGPKSTGGQVSVITGYSSLGSSGNLLLQTANSGTPPALNAAVSGFVVLSTCTSSNGASGGVIIGSDIATGGNRVDCCLNFVPAIILTALSMTSSGSALFGTGNSDKNSGSVAITTGVATGGAGGTISLAVGAGSAGVGGSVTVAAGSTTGSTGGKVAVMTGYSSTTTSGNLVLETANAGAAGVSGALVLSTGSASKGSSGSVYIGTGTLFVRYLLRLAL